MLSFCIIALRTAVEKPFAASPPLTHHLPNKTMTPPQGGSQRHLRPYQVAVHQDSSPVDGRGAADAASADDLAKTDDLIRKLAEANGRSRASSGGVSSSTHGRRGRGSSSSGPSRKFRQYPQSYHDQPYEEEGPGAGPDLSSPYRGGDGRDAPPGYEFAVRSPYQQGGFDGGGRSGAAVEPATAEAALRAEEEARRMAEATREMTGESRRSDRVGGGREDDDGMASYIGDGVQSCVRSMLSCLHTSAEGTLLGYSAAPEVTSVGMGSVGGNPYVSNSIYGGFTDNSGNAPPGAPPSSEKSGLLGSVMMR